MKNIKITDEAIRETCLAAGFLLVGVGLWMIYRPAAFLVCGSLLMWLGIPPRKKGKGGE